MIEKSGKTIEEIGRGKSMRIDFESKLGFLGTTRRVLIQDGLIQVTEQEVVKQQRDLSPNEMRALRRWARKMGTLDRKEVYGNFVIPNSDAGFFKIVTQIGNEINVLFATPDAYDNPPTPVLNFANRLMDLSE
jgi:hypothetical protein